MDGHVKMLNREKGYGFILASEVEYFFHRTALFGSVNFDLIRIGAKVTFEPIETERGLRAAKVRCTE